MRQHGELSGRQKHGRNRHPGAGASRLSGPRAASVHGPVPCPGLRLCSVPFFATPDTTMANYVYTMNRVGKIVPPKRHILKDISLSFFPGAKIGVLGLNGSGKSTLLKIMAGIDKDIEGEAIPQPNLNIGYLPQ